jgi:hypothetical protein
LFERTTVLVSRPQAKAPGFKANFARLAVALAG